MVEAMKMYYFEIRYLETNSLRGKRALLKNLIVPLQGKAFFEFTELGYSFSCIKETNSG